MSVGGQRYAYGVYGVVVTSDRPFDLPPADMLANPLTEVQFHVGGDDAFARVPAAARQPVPWFGSMVLKDGSTYARWGELGEVSVAHDGSRVTHRPLPAGDAGVFERFLFGQALSFALVRQGLEPLHAAVVAINDAAVALVGDCTFGKSTLAGAFVQAGYRLITDDLLLVDTRGGQLRACPGSGRIKLQPDSALAFLGRRDGTRLHTDSTKCSFRLAVTEVEHAALPLRQVIVLPDPAARATAQEFEVTPLPRAATCHQLLRNSFNIEILDDDRLARQFACAADLASGIDAYAARYPPGLDRVPAIRDWLVSHVNQTVEEAVS